MYVFLPDKGVTLNQFYQDLSTERWAQWMSKFTPKRGTVAVPKLKLSYSADLKPELRSLGMTAAFDPARADFGNLFANDEPLFISFVLHKTFLDMNERGTEAAAATVVGMRTTSAAPSTPFEMVVDRPYMLAIRDDQTGAVLFLGSIMDPS